MSGDVGEMGGGWGLRWIGCFILYYRHSSGPEGATSPAVTARRSTLWILILMMQELQMFVCFQSLSSRALVEVVSIYCTWPLISYSCTIAPLDIDRFTSRVDLQCKSQSRFRLRLSFTCTFVGTTTFPALIIALTMLPPDTIPAAVPSRRTLPVCHV